MDLFEGNGLPERKAKKPDSRVVMLEAAFVERHTRRWTIPPLLTPYGKNRKLLKDLAGQLPDDEILALMDRFFATRDREVERTSYSIADFVRLVPHLRLQGLRSNGGSNSRTAGNMDAAEKAIRRKP